MKKSYVPKTITEFLGESKSITLKRKYGERPTVTVGANAPLRNQVLSYVAESRAVSKIDLKKFIIGLKEGGSTLAAANMFIKRNAKYFMTENRNGITYFKLSNLGQRLVNQFVPMEDTNVSESVKIARRKLSQILEEKYQNRLDEDEDEELEEDTIENPEEAEAEDFEAEDAAEEIDFEEGRFSKELKPEDSEGHVESDQFEYEEDDEKITLTYWKTPKDEDLESEEETEEDLDELEDSDEEDFDEDNLQNRPKGELPDYDFKDKGRPGILGMEESAHMMRAQFVSHKLTSKKSPKLGGKLNPKFHNLLDDKQDKDPNELKEANNLGKKLDPKLHNLLGDKEVSDEDVDNLAKELTESYSNLMSSEEFEEFVQDLIELDDIDIAKKELKGLFDNNPKMHEQTGEIEGKDMYKKGLDMFREYYKSKQTTLESVKASDSVMKDKMKTIIENLKAKRTEKLNEAEESEEDELSDEDIEKANAEEPEEAPEEVEDELATTLDGEDEVEKVEITEFIVTVDNVDSAIDELAELGVTAERVAVEAPVEEELPVEVEYEVEAPAEEVPVEETPEEEKLEKSNESLDEAEEEKEGEELDLGSSDELGLGDQGEEAPELEDQPEETLEPTTEFEENKIKVKAEDWPALKGWLEEKGVDVAEMFGGDIEIEEVDDDEVEAEIEEEPKEEISDEDIDFSGIGEDDDTKVKEE